MSYEIVKRITFKKDGVYLAAESNNVFPKYFHSRKSPSLTEIFENEGKRAVDLVILKEYESGMFQSTQENRYTKALKCLRAMPEYSNYDWRTANYVIRKSEEFHAMFEKALDLTNS